MQVEEGPSCEVGGYRNVADLLLSQHCQETFNFLTQVRHDLLEVVVEE